MADVTINKFRASVVRDGSKPASPGFIVSEGQDPVNPPGTNNYVPYSGATANVELGEFGVEAGFIKLDTTPTDIPTEQGGIYWDDARSTAALIMNGTLQHIGQDTFFYVKNSTGSSIAKGTAVRFDGTDGASGHLKIAPFLANGTYPSNYFMGVTAEVIANGSFGQVMHFGELTGVNTSGYTAGALLYASTSVAGAFQTTAPVAPNNIVLVAAAINSTNNGTILVRPTYGSNINQDEGVKITSGTTGDLLQLQAGGLWENKTLAQVIGTAYVPSTRTITINGTTQDLSANRTYNVGTVTAVTASSPLFSSGGTTPNITIQQASGSQSGFLSSTDWTTFNGKQNALTNPVTGTGTSGQVAYFSGTSAITGDSDLVFDGNNLTLGGNLTAGNKLNNEFIFQNNGTFSGGSGAATTLNVKFGGQTIALISATGTDQRDGIFKLLDEGVIKVNIAANNTRGGATYFNGGGNVLIGTASDGGSRLQVNGTSTFDGLVTTTSIYRITQASVARGGLYTFNQWIGSGTDYSIGLTSEVDLFFSTGGTTTKKVIFTSAGNLLIGPTTDAGFKLDVNGTGRFSAGVQSIGTEEAFRFQRTTGTASDIYSLNADSGSAYLYNNTTANVLMTWAEGGNVGIGTTSPVKTLDVRGTLAISNSASSFWYMDRDDSDGRFKIVDDGNNDRFNITTGGNVLIGRTSDIGGKLQVNGQVRADNFGVYIASAFRGGLYTFNSVAGAGTDYSVGIFSEGEIFLAPGGSATKRMSMTNAGAVTFSNLGTGTVTATAGLLSTVSDLSYKIEDGYIDKAIEKVLNLKPRYFYWNEKSGLPKDIRQLGFYAQEVNQALGEEAANTPKNENTPWGISDRSIIAMLTKAIQELKQEIDTLKK